MIFANKIKQLMEEKQLLQRHLAFALDIDTPIYSKIERGDRRAKREQVFLIAKFFDTDEDKLLAFWLADQVEEVLVNDKDKTTDVFNIVNNSFNNK